MTMKTCGLFATGIIRLRHSELKKKYSCIGTLEDSSLVHGNDTNGRGAANAEATKAIVPPLPSIELGGKSSGFARAGPL